ncbi:hypothetical protein F4779DRAFT_625160 [Xylariaceae sp. FL0662B]|nr:hypothetical protein F4779DRAFT_625160 [Xylariaceae sp. FL0662B]
MDAQNAVESATTKQPASPKRGSKALRSVQASSIAQDDDAGPEQNSDAETIVLPGKETISPSKPRKVIKHEDKSDGEMDDLLPPPGKHPRDGKDADRSGGPSEESAAPLGRKKRPFDKEREKLQRTKDASSGLSSAPASPPQHRRNGHEQSDRRRKSGDAHSESGSESPKSKSYRDAIKHKSKSVDRLLSGKRKAPKAESEDEGETRKARRPRISDPNLDNSVATKEKDPKSSSRQHFDKHSTSRNRSLSPHGRIHRRSLSTQLPSQSSNGFSSKKRRIPAPLQSTDYHSDDSSASGSPHPRSSKLRSIATPLTGECTVSPVKMPPHKKHVDNHGQTLLAKACAKGEYATAKRRLAERPEDLNFADYAGNTPLQIASLNGHEDIVQLLIDAGCNLDCRNSDKETPLLDAVENGHLGVVKILLKSGVNPRKADAEGHEPLEKVPDDLDNADEIRAALKEAKERVGELRRTSEDHQPHEVLDTLSSHGAESPRRSPTASASGTLAAQRRAGTTLRQAAARGDNETDPEALVNAARGGSANPDPRPNIEVVKLLLNANHFDPTRPRRREGPNWKEEEHMLKNAYDDYKKASKGGSKLKSSPKRDRDHASRSHKRRPSSPSRDVSGSPKPKKRSLSLGNNEEQTSPKRGPGRPKKEERASTNATSDREISPPVKAQPTKFKLADSELAAGSSDGEAVKPRRKLISGKDLKGHRERQRHASEKPRPDRLSEKYHDRTKALKRKRHRSNDSEAPVKRRKLDADGKERHASRDPSKRQRPSESERKDASKVKKATRDQKASITVASEELDVEMHSEAQAERERKEAKRRQAELESIAAEEAKKKEAERQRQEDERKKQEAEAKRQEEAAEKKRLEEEERNRLEREERKRKEEEERVRLEEERKRREEQERKQREEERKRKEAEERRQREEEERIRREKEAAEEARRLREEEEQKERERIRAERAAREAELQRARQEELERIRLSKLPPLLRWLNSCPDPKQREIAELFTKAQGVRYDTINTAATGKPDGREQWLLNTQVALLLGEKDTSLSRYTAWERIPLSHIAKRVIWRLEQDRYALTEGRLYHLGEQLPGYYDGDPRTVGYRRLEQLRGEAAKCFFETDMFFVKESDFLYIVPTVPHLRNVKLSICYCELPEHESALTTWSAPAKWKQDPDAESRGSFAPRSKYYINGQLVGEDRPKQYKPSKDPFPENRVPRRGNGLVAVMPGEPDYVRLCIEQGLTHLLTDQQKQAVLNGAHLTPRSMVSNEPADYSGDNLSPSTGSPNTNQANVSPCLYDTQQSGSCIVEFLHTQSISVLRDVMVFFYYHGTDGHDSEIGNYAYHHYWLHGWSFCS